MPVAAFGRHELRLPGDGFVLPELDGDVIRPGIDGASVDSATRDRGEELCRLRDGPHRRVTQIDVAPEPHEEVLGRPVDPS